MKKDSLKENIYRILTVAGAILISAPIVYLFIYLIAKPLTAYSFAVTASGVAVGFSLQSLLCRITGNRPVLYRSGRISGAEEGFSLGKAMIPAAAVLLSSPLVRFLADTFMVSRLSEAELTKYRDGEAFGLYIAAAFTLCAFFGIALWFTSFDRAADRNMISAYVVIFFAEYMGALLTGSGLDGVVGICAALFTAVYLFLSNKNFLDRRDVGHGVFVMSRNAHSKNRRAVALCLVLTAGVFFVFRSLLSYIKAFMFLAFRDLAELLFSGDYAPNKPQAMPESFTESSGYLPYIFADRSLDFIAPLITAVLLFFFLLGLVLYSNKLLVPFFGIIKKIWEELLGFLKRPFRGEKEVDVADEMKSFKDEVTHITDAPSDTFDGIRDYAAFMKRLGSISVFEERLMFAYGSLVRLLRRHNEAILVSDTPREILHKLKIKDLPEMKEITEVFEMEEYALRDAPEDVRMRVLDRICALVKVYI